MGTRRGTDKWSCYHWAEYGDVVTSAKALGVVGPGIMVIEPPFSELAFAEGVFDEVNDALGTHLDDYNEETIPTELLEDAATILLAARERLRASGKEVLMHEVAWGPPGDLDGEWQAEIAEMDMAEFTDLLGRLAGFLSEAGKKRKEVVCWL